MNHPGPATGTGLRLIEVSPSIKLYLNPEFELRRAAFMSPLIQQHGLGFKKAPFDDRFPRLDERGVCYANAAQLATAYPDLLTYCEGLMLFKLPDGRVFPLPHGWCCTRSGHVVDPTCSRRQMEPEVLYVGLPVYVGYLTRWKALTGYWGLLDGHHEYGKRVGIYRDHPAKWLQLLAEELPRAGLLY